MLYNHEYHRTHHWKADIYMKSYTYTGVAANSIISNICKNIFPLFGKGHMNTEESLRMNYYDMKNYVDFLPIELDLTKHRWYYLFSQDAICFVSFEDFILAKLLI